MSTPRQATPLVFREQPELVVWVESSPWQLPPTHAYCVTVRERVPLLLQRSLYEHGP